MATTLHDSLFLELNACSAEFCPSPSHPDLLAIGTYQLQDKEQDEHHGERIGRMYLYNIQHRGEEEGPQYQLSLSHAEPYLPGEPSIHHYVLGQVMTPCSNMPVALALLSDLTAGETSSLALFLSAGGVTSCRALSAASSCLLRILTCFLSFSCCSNPARGGRGDDLKCVTLLLD